MVSRPLSCRRSKDRATYCPCRTQHVAYTCAGSRGDNRILCCGIAYKAPAKTNQWWIWLWGFQTLQGRTYSVRNRIKQKAPERSDKNSKKKKEKNSKDSPWETENYCSSHKRDLESFEAPDPSFLKKVLRFLWFILTTRKGNKKKPTTYFKYQTYFLVRRSHKSPSETQSQVFLHTEPHASMHFGWSSCITTDVNTSCVVFSIVPSLAGSIASERQFFLVRLHREFSALKQFAPFTLFGSGMLSNILGNISSS